MKERPIIFSGPMVQAILAGRKTQTRRLVKPAIECQHHYLQPMFGVTTDGRPRGTPGVWREVGPDYPDGDEDDRRCPVAVGDRLWVRETFYCDHAFYGDYEGDWGYVNKSPTREERIAEWKELLFYRADDDTHDWEDGPVTWSSPIHMPRWASRITLEVTAVRAQRLQEISEDDAKAEGVQSFFERFSCIGRDQCLNTGELAAASPYRASFAVAWDEVNGDKALWKSNPWVWAYTFRRVKRKRLNAVADSSKWRSGNEHS